MNWGNVGSVDVHWRGDSDGLYVGSLQKGEEKKRKRESRYLVQHKRHLEKKMDYCDLVPSARGLDQIRSRFIECLIPQASTSSS